jgi:hypothetical protein
LGIKNKRRVSIKLESKDGKERKKGKMEGRKKGRKKGTKEERRKERKKARKEERKKSISLILDIRFWSFQKWKQI